MVVTKMRFNANPTMVTAATRISSSGRSAEAGTRLSCQPSMIAQVQASASR
ncbi:hypothetical protein NB717_003987 [Xanthomonas sacchari]|nr:hypothetical protein [Xanthomonas sacchari]MCW0462919.1 hypothetical protein [Xanthomonas sacchari]